LALVRTERDSRVLRDHVPDELELGIAQLRSATGRGGIRIDEL